jgi:hypothetical protein
LIQRSARKFVGAFFANNTLDQLAKKVAGINWTGTRIAVISRMQMDLIDNLCHDINKHCHDSSLKFILILIWMKCRPLN